VEGDPRMKLELFFRLEFPAGRGEQEGVHDTGLPLK
jgi:hypothetical protein